MNEEELNMMKSVMSKLFEGENDSKAASSGAGLSEEGDDSIKSIDDLLLDENANGEDNLILNMVTRGNNRMPLLGSWEQDKISANQESRIREFHNSNGEPTQNIHKVQRKEDCTF
ncbi:hypothetical protein L1049_022625 [Liquidambar formosana]|uniref:Uncharacterized protein n=1 Tax=Liquidambar formosana TaxID=63359 RepID=A0AAP0RCT5_LIQFO